MRSTTSRLLAPRKEMLEMPCYFLSTVLLRGGGRWQHRLPKRSRFPFTDGLLLDPALHALCDLCATTL